MDASRTTAPLGFAGLGNMGWPMAAGLVAAGHQLVVHDRDAERQERFVREIGAHGADAPVCELVSDRWAAAAAARGATADHSMAHKRWWARDFGEVEQPPIAVDGENS